MNAGHQGMRTLLAGAAGGSRRAQLQPRPSPCYCRPPTGPSLQPRPPREDSTREQALPWSRLCHCLGHHALLDTWVLACRADPHVAGASAPSPARLQLPHMGLSQVSPKALFPGSVPAMPLAPAGASPVPEQDEAIQRGRDEAGACPGAPGMLLFPRCPGDRLEPRGSGSPLGAA